MKRNGIKGVSPDALVRSVPLIVIVCRRVEEVEELTSLLGGEDIGRLLNYAEVGDLALNAPRGEVALVIFANAMTPEGASRALRWLNRHWPRCLGAVVTDEGTAELETAVRSRGAMFFVRPVSNAEWRSMLSVGLRGAARRAAQLIG